MHVQDPYHDLRIFQHLRRIIVVGAFQDREKSEEIPIGIEIGDIFLTILADTIGFHPSFPEEITLDLEEYIKTGQKISFIVHGQLRPVTVDPNLLRNVLTNLLSNAIKYSRENTTVRFELRIEFNRFAFLVADQGICIPLEEQEHLFERFFRARNTTGIPGTGLGLSIVRKYLDLMNGDIRVASRPGEGSVFEVAFKG